MFGWLFGKREREPVRTVVVQSSRSNGMTEGFIHTFTAELSQSGWVAMCGRNVIFLHEDGSTTGWIVGTWKPLYGWPVEEFPVVPLTPS